MPIPVVCPSCATRLRAQDKMAGQKTRCPKCGTAVVVPSSVHEAPQPARPEPLTQPVKRVEPPAARPKSPAPAPLPEEDDFELEPQSRRRPSAAAAVSNIVVVQQPSRAAHSLGIAALVIGVLSFFVCWIPFLGIAVSGLGLLLGLGGLVLAIVRRGSGVGFSIAGSGLSALSLVMCLGWTFALSSAFKAADSAMAKQHRTNQNVVLDGDGDQPTAQDLGEAFPPTQSKSSLPPTNSEPEWADASKGAVQQGGVRVRVASLEVDFVKGKEFGAFTSKEKLLKITLQIENTNPNRKVDYQGWGGSHAFLADDAPRLTDNFANTYKRINFGLASRVDGQVQSESIYPGKAITDVLVFEVPLDTIEYLRMELPAKNFEGAGRLRLQISKAIIQR